MRDDKKTTTELIEEVEALRRLVAGQGKSEAEGQEAQREEAEKYKALIETTDTGYLILDSEGKVVDANSEYVRLSGHTTLDEIVGRSVVEWTTDHDRERNGVEVAKCLQQGFVRGLEIDYVDREGQITPIEIQATVIKSGNSFQILSLCRDITNRRRAEAALGLSEEKYQLLVNNTNEGITVVQDLTIRFANPRAAEITGYPLEELIGKPLLELVHPDDHAIVRERTAKRLKGEPVKPNNIYKGITKNGDIQWIEMHVVTNSWEGRPANLYFFRDITERLRAEEDLKTSREHLRSLMESASNFSVYRLVLDKENPFALKVVFVSPSLTEIMGLSDPLKFESWFEAMHPDDVERVIAANHKAFETHKFNESYRFFHPQKKEWRWIHAISTGVLDEEQQTRYVNGIMIDITDKRKVEEALLEAYNTLDERVKIRTHQLQLINERLKIEIKERKLIESNLRKSKDKLRLLSNRLINAQENERKRISIELHDELGQSLVGLKFQLSSFQKKLGKNQKELKQEIKQASDSIDLMTENVRRLSRDLRPSVLEHLGLFDALQWLFGDFSKKYHIKVLKKIKRLDFSLFKEQELIVFRIFQEALANIGKHAQATQVLIELTEGEKSAVFSIKDNGRGFNSKVVQGRNPSESGLGLTAMAERAQMAGGDLAIKSGVGKGTLITFSIPIKRPRKKSTPLNPLE
jgi:PAS domain S-box-containing protein